MSNVPTAIAIGPMRYRVTTDKADYNAVVATHNVHFYGFTDLGNARITIEGTQDVQHQRWTLLHEVLHGCWHMTEPEGTRFTEEQAIRVLTGPLLDTLRRNPDLVAFLLADEKEENDRRPCPPDSRDAA